jgi:serine/threonine protein kinase
MNEMKNLAAAEDLQTPIGNSGGSSDDTTDLSGAEATQHGAVDSGDSTEGDPRKIGRYRIIRRVGQGGFGRVYLGHDDDLDRPVAIKVPSPERITRPQDVQAFLTEARILAKLDHPNIVPVHDVGRTEDGLCFVVSKLIEGSELSIRLAQARPFRQSAELVATIAEALHYAHTKGLVHRDIKPGNILIDGSGKPCVVDFGLAMRDEDFGKVAAIAGTPPYMSPEQARGEGHRVDGRSDIFSLGIVFYELLTGRRPFRGDSHREVLDQIVTTEPRPPRQMDDSIPRELERICLRSMMKRASDRYTTARDMAEDLRLFLQVEKGAGSPVSSAVPFVPTGSTVEEAPLPSTDQKSDSDQRPVKIVPKGLRAFDQQDADFFLELLPGPRDRDGLPESIRFWKKKIEQLDPDLTFKVALIYGPSGCGKSSQIKAGLLPRLAKHVITVYVEATAEDTEGRLLKGLRRVCPELPRELGLVASLARLRRGQILPGERKVLLVIDQFEQWLFSKRADDNTELVAALRHCDGDHVQAIVTVRDDFWLAASRFMRDLEIRVLEGENSSLVDLFDPRHAKKVLMSFGRAYGALPDTSGDLDREQRSFLDLSITGLAQDGKVIPVRLALFAEMMKGKPWTPAALREVGGTEGVGLTFLEETFSASTAPPEHRLHQQAAQGVLSALLPETGTDIKGRMRSRQELLEASGYASRAGDFDDLIRLLDPELRLITPTDPEGSVSEGQPATPSGHFYQLSHDYLVHPLREWLTRKQRESRRGRAALRLAERSASWNARPENRLLPSALEWANIRLLTKDKDWTDPQRKTMRRAGRVHGIRGVLTLALLAAGVLAGIAARRQVIENQRAIQAAGLVQRLRDADTPQVPEIVNAMHEYRSFVDPLLKSELEKAPTDSRQKLHASLAVLPVDATQVDYLFDRLTKAEPAQLVTLRDALKTHRSTVTPKLWRVLERAEPGDASVLPCAGALAGYDPDNTKWESVDEKVAQALVSVNPVFLGLWLDALRSVRGRLTAPLVAIFQDTSRAETVHSLATNILADFAAADPDRLAELLMVADHKSYLTFFPVAAKMAEEILPVFQSELAKKPTYSWSDPKIDPAWTTPDATLQSAIESAHGLLADRFAFCQTLPLVDFATIVEALRKAGYRPVRFRPYADEQTVRVAAVWTRDGRNWRISSGLTAGEIQDQDDRNRKDRFLVVDVAGYVTAGAGDKPADRYAALWVERTSDDDARMYAGTTADEEAEVHDKLKDEKLIPRTRHFVIGSDGNPIYCGVWGRPPRSTVTGRTLQPEFQDNFRQRLADPRDHLVTDIAVSGASKPQAIRERAQAALASADRKLKTKPDDLDARFSLAMAHLRLGDHQKALEDLQAVIDKNSENISAKKYRVIALARLGNKQDALTELAKFQKEEVPDGTKLCLAVVVAAELGEGLHQALDAMEAATKKLPDDAELRYEAARAFSLASMVVSRSDKAKGRQLAERARQSLSEAVKSDDADFGKMDEDSDLDPIRDDPAFAEIMRAGHPGRRYAAVWNGDTDFEAMSVHGLDPAAHLRKCGQLTAQGYRPVSCSASRCDQSEPLVTASVWHRPAVQDDVKDRLAERQARAAISLVRMGKAPTPGFAVSSSTG